MNKGASGTPMNRPVNAVEAEMRHIVETQGDQAAYDFAAKKGIPQVVAHQVIGDVHTNAGKTGREERAGGELAVNLPNGEIVQANSKDAAKKATEDVILHQSMMDRLVALRDAMVQ